MDIVDVVRKIIEIDTQPIILYRAFVKSETSNFIKKRLNDILDESPELAATVIVLSIYPALEWNLKGKEIDAVMEHIAVSNTEIRALENTQNLIMKASGMQPKLLLKERTAYFETCEALVTLLDRNIEKIHSFPDNGETYYALLRAIIGKVQDLSLSKFLISKHMRDAVTLLHDLCFSNLEKLLDAILDGYVVDDEELQMVYHNTTLLLKEYNRILWYAQTSDDKAMKLLNCGSEKEMIEITESDGKFCQAYLIVEYAKLISGAVEMVREFPIYGEEYYKILMSILDSKQQKVRDEMLAQKIGMSTYTYSVKKRRALAVLGSILWGCDGDTFVRLLTSEN